jgi:hypothetical protein
LLDVAFSVDAKMDVEAGGVDEAQWLTVVDKGADGQTSVRELIRVRFSRLETVV